MRVRSENESGSEGEGEVKRVLSSSKVIIFPRPVKHVADIDNRSPGNRLSWEQF